MAPLVRTGGSRHTGLAALPHRNIHARHDRVGMTDSLMQDIPVYVPRSLEEQQKIADCLSSLDDVIEKQKATLVAWEEMKKGLLQQMFV